MELCLYSCRMPYDVRSDGFAITCHNHFVSTHSARQAPLFKVVSRSHVHSACVFSCTFVCHLFILFGAVNSENNAGVETYGRFSRAWLNTKLA